MDNIQLILQQIVITLNKAVALSPSHLSLRLAKTFALALKEYQERKSIATLKQQTVWAFRAMMEGSTGSREIDTNLMNEMQELLDMLPD